MVPAYQLEEISAEHRFRHSSRRRGEANLRRSSAYGRSFAFQRELTVKKQHLRIAEVTEKESANVANLLQLQVENFFRKIEIQSLRDSVTELLEARDTASQTLRLFQCELETLERGVSVGEAAQLDYEMSERDWQDIVEQ